MSQKHFTDDTSEFRFRRIFPVADDTPTEWLLKSIMTFNSREWRGHPPDAVAMLGHNWMRRDDGSAEMVTRFTLGRSPYHAVMNSAGEVLDKFRVYGEADFNEMDFGDLLPVTEWES